MTSRSLQSLKLVKSSSSRRSTRPENRQPDIKLLQAEKEDGIGPFHLRVLVDGHTIKYIRVDSGILSRTDLPEGRSMSTILPLFPPEDWNTGRVSRESDGPPFFLLFGKKIFRGVEDTWHRTFVEYMDLSVGERLSKEGYVYRVECPLFDRPVIAKFAPFEWAIDSIDKETGIYRWMHEQGIGPKFLGHITENDRVIGFLLEEITSARRPGPEDESACRGVLTRLHGLGITHGSIERSNFLVNRSGTYLLDFEGSVVGGDQRSMREELNRLNLGPSSRPNSRGTSTLYLQH